MATTFFESSNTAVTIYCGPSDNADRRMVQITECRTGKFITMSYADFQTMVESSIRYIGRRQYE